MERYPEKSVEFEFILYILEATANIPLAVTYAPILETDISEPFILEPGEEWSLTLAVSDVDNDFADIIVDFSGAASDFLAFDYDQVTLYVSNPPGMQLGAFLATVVLTDYEGNASEWPITI